jgi:glucosamine--fructose-6-phosphate aminotransferase (isomerizing)
MCGIFGYVGPKQNAGKIILDGLKTLEYRGYDSWGVAVKKENNDLYIEKHVGKISNAELPEMTSHIGLGHTRWATHGGVSERNAHPYYSCNKEVVVVHNGIVENYDVLKKDLLAKGHTFDSDTDTEVIPHLIEENMKTEQDLQNVIETSWQALNGMNAIIAFFPKEESFFVMKNGSPIVLGKTDDEFIIASDASAIVEHTRKVYFLEDNDMLYVNKNEAVIISNGQKKPITFTELQYDSTAATLGDYKHFMMKEINEQPKVLENIILTQHEHIKQLADKIVKAYGTYLIGCGTASYACLAGTYLFSKITKRHVNHAISSEFTYSLDFLKDTSLIVPVSQSGETIDTLSSMKLAKEKGAQIASLTNTLGSTIYRTADFNMLLNAGPEKAVASTKAYTAMIAYLYLTAHEINKTFDTGASDLRAAIKEINTIIGNKETIQKLASQIQNEENIFVLGRGVSYAAALESALKIKEVSYIHAEGFAAGELKHGVIALVREKTPVIIFNPEDETHEDTLSSAHEVKARGAYVIGVSSKPNEVYDMFIQVNNCHDATIIPNVVIAQLLGYYLALEKGFDPDKPRNLAKSVVVK